MVDKNNGLVDKFFASIHFNEFLSRLSDNLAFPQGNEYETIIHAFTLFQKKRMKKSFFYSSQPLAWLSVALLVMTAACSKSTSTTTTGEGNWVTRSELEGVARSEAVSFTINDLAYIGTGYDGTNRLKDFWEYNSDQNFWTQKAEFPGEARNSAIAFDAGGKGYVGTGFDGTVKLKDFWQYDPVSNSWAQKADFGGSARYDAVAFGINGKGYVTTGFDGNYLKDFWLYDPESDSWTQKVSMGGSKRSGAVVFVHNNKAYIVTGTNNGTTVNDFWSYDPSADGWTELRKISNVSTDTYDDAYAIVRGNGVAFVMSDKAYVVCGENGAIYRDCWEYDFATDLWVKKTAFEGTERTGALGFAIKNRGFVTTGRNSSLSFDDLREFLPFDTYNAND